MTKAEKQRHIIYWQARKMESWVSLHGSHVLLDNAGKLLQFFCMFSNSLAVYG